MVSMPAYQHTRTHARKLVPKILKNPLSTLHVIIAKPLRETAKKKKNSKEKEKQARWQQLPRIHCETKRLTKQK